MKIRKSAKFFIATVFAMVLVLGSAISAFAATGTWEQDSTGWWFSFSTGGYAKKQWLEINKKYYYFNEDGYMAAGEYRDGYWLEGSGARSATYTGGTWMTNKTGKWYQDKTGYYPTGAWLKIDGSYYYFETSGYLAVNKWVDNKYYVDKDGKWIDGAKYIDYSGTYIDTFAGRAKITVTNTYDNYYSFKVSWPSSASVENVWEFSGIVDQNGTLNYTNAYKTEINYDSTGGSTKKTVYNDGTGTIKMTEKDLTWEDKKEDVARGNTFSKASEAEVEGKDHTGTYPGTVDNRSAITFKASMNGFYNVTIGMPDEEGNLDEYTFSGKFDAEGKLTYTDCVKTHETFKTDGSTTVKQVYKKGSGNITYKDGTYTWTNDNEDIEYNKFK